jgi:accessory gene regulator protein AgrB
MDIPPNTHTDNNSQWTSIGSAVHEILRESRKRRVVIRKSSGEKIIECSVLLALILSIGAPVLPAFVILGVLVEVISISFEKN